MHSMLLDKNCALKRVFGMDVVRFTRALSAVATRLTDLGTDLSQSGAIGA